MKWVLIIIVAVVFLAGGAVVAYSGHASKKPSNWKTDKIHRGELEVTVTATGSVSPARSITIGSQISGLVKEVRKGANSPVRKGDVLALLDTELLEAERRTAEVKLNQCKAALDGLSVEHENLRLRELRQKAAIERKRISVERAGASLELASKTRVRYEELVKHQAATVNDLETRQLEEDNARRDFRLMQIDLEDSKIDDQQIVADTRQLAAREEQAHADVEQAQSALDRAKTNISYATITSPIDGVVLEQKIDVGQTIAASFQTPDLFTIASNLTHIQVEARVDEADIGKIALDQNVTFDADAYRGETFNGKVTLLHLQPDTKSNLVTYPVSIDAENPTDAGHPYGKLLPGMTVTLRFVMEKHPNALLLPAAALRFTPPEGAQNSVPDLHPAQDSAPKKGTTRGTVYLVGAMGQLQPKVLSVGCNDNQNYEILDGDLHENDPVVVGRNDGAMFDPGDQ